MKESGKDRLKSTIYESTRAPLTRSPLPRWGRQRGGGLAAKKEANPASLRSAAPSMGRGLLGRSLLPMEGGAPKGRRLDGESGMKKSGRDRFKCAINESTRAPLARSPFPDGEGKEEGASPPQKEANPASLRSAAPSKGRGSRGHSPPSYGRRCPEGAEVGWEKRYLRNKASPWETGRGIHFSFTNFHLSMI